jgi:hypothetical protein
MSSVLESNIYGSLFSLAETWTVRQDRAARLRQAEADAQRASQAAASSAPPMVVRLAAVEAVNIAQQLVPGAILDGETLAAGDTVLLTRQAVPTQNGPWLVGDRTRPPGFVNAAGRQFYVAGGTARRGTLYLCTAAAGGAGVALQPVLARPALRDALEERGYTSDLDVRAATLGRGGDALALALSPADSVNAGYVGGTCGVGAKAPVRVVVADGPVALSDGGLPVTATVGGGVTLAAGDRVLLAAQPRVRRTPYSVRCTLAPTDARENGLYVAGAAGRAPDLRAGCTAAGVLVFATSSTRCGGRRWPTPWPGPLTAAWPPSSPGRTSPACRTWRWRARGAQATIGRGGVGANHTQAVSTYM